MVHGPRLVEYQKIFRACPLSYIFLSFYFSYENIVLDHGTIFLKCLSFLGVKIVGKGASILTGLAEIVKKALKG